MLPLPRIILIDDNADHLRSLADGLNRCGAACLQVHFQGEGDVKACPHVRIIFADLHLTQGGPGTDHTKHFTVIGGLIEEKIVPAGPYVIVLWTRFADQAKGLEIFLNTRLEGVAKPVAVRSLDKAKHLDLNGKVTNVETLSSAIEALFEDEPQLRALMNWEERILGAAAETVVALLGIALTDADPEKRRKSLGRLLRKIGTEAVGEGHVAADRFRAVNEGLLPILADRVAFLRSEAASTDLWNQALEGEEANLSSDEAAALNCMLHVADEAEAGSAADRGAVIAVPEVYVGGAFEKSFGMDEVTAATKQFSCKGYVKGDPRFNWVLVQVQAACDFAQQHPGPLPYLLGLEMPIESRNTGRAPESVWQSVALRLGGANRVLHVNARFGLFLAESAVAKEWVKYRLRETLLNDLVYRTHSHGARPGFTSFREEKTLKAKGS
jgi:hypothetical protein